MYIFPSGGGRGLDLEAPGGDGDGREAGAPGEEALELLPLAFICLFELTRRLLTFEE